MHEILLSDWFGKVDFFDGWILLLARLVNIFVFAGIAWAFLVSADTLSIFFGILLAVAHNFEVFLCPCEIADENSVVKLRGEWVLDIWVPTWIINDNKEWQDDSFSEPSYSVNEFVYFLIAFVIGYFSLFLTMLQVLLHPQ